MDEAEKMHDDKRRKKERSCLFKTEQAPDIINMTVALLRATKSIESAEFVMYNKPPIRCDVFLRERELKERVDAQFYRVDWRKDLSK